MDDMDMSRICYCLLWWWKSCHWCWIMFHRISIAISIATILNPSTSPIDIVVLSYLSLTFICITFVPTLCICQHSKFNCQHCHLFVLLHFKRVVLFMIKGWHLQRYFGSWELILGSTLMFSTIWISWFFIICIKISIKQQSVVAIYS